MRGPVAAWRGRGPEERRELMGEIRYPAVVIDHGKLRENVTKVRELCEGHGIKVAGVIKGANGIVSVAKDLTDCGIDMLASSRLEQLARVKNAGIPAKLLMIRVPMLSEAEELVRICDASLNSEMKTLEALNEAALGQNRKHGVILMADLGDLREGYFDHQELKDAAVKVEKDLKGLELLGIGTNLGCYGSVMPTKDKMDALAALAEDVEGLIGRPLEIVSGGATSSLMGVFDDYMPEKVNMLRIGAGILVGPLDETCTCYGYHQMEMLNDDSFVLEAQVIEVKLKASHPIGTLGVDAFGHKNTYVDRGMRKRALCAVGGADFGDPGDIIPLDPGVQVVGCSGDHLILDVEDATVTPEVGDIIRFKPRYTALLRLTGSENVHIIDKQEN